MTGKNATPLIGWHSANPATKPRLVAEAERRGITLRELLDEMADEYLERAEFLKGLAGKEIHHRDGDPRNNDLSNLEVRDAPRESSR